MFEALAKALAAGLSLWESKEKRKYVDRVIELKRAHYEEYNKDPAHRSDAVLDNLEHELRIVAIGFAASVGAENPPGKS